MSNPRSAAVPASYRLVALDMDGTLLRPDGTVPPRFWDIAEELFTRGVIVAPASGRQLATLREMFEPLGEHLSLLAENGAVVYHQGAVSQVTALDSAAARRVIDAVDPLPDVDIVVSCPDCAYVPRGAHPDLPEIRKYYRELKEVPEIRDAVSGQQVKIALYTPGDAEAEILPRVLEAAGDQAVMTSGQHWIDVMSPTVDKGVGLRNLAAALGVEIAETVAFGDYMNDYPLITTAGLGIAMENGHPRVKAAADRIAPSNARDGVITVLEELFGLA